jgi:hypothetical protein
MPFVLPVTRFSSTTLPLATPIRPMPKSSGGSLYPFAFDVFSRTRLLWPTIHMPPHDSPATVDPLRTVVLPSMRAPNELARTWTPEPQLVEIVSPSMRTSVDPVTRMPVCLKR